MQMPLDIKFHNIPPSAAVSAAIRTRVEKLERLCDSIIGCQVTIDSPRHHKHHGALFSVQIRLSVPDAVIVVDGGPGCPSHDDAFIAIHQAFDVAQRELQQYVSGRHGGGAGPDGTHGAAKERSSP